MRSGKWHVWLVRSALLVATAVAVYHFRRDLAHSLSLLCRQADATQIIVLLVLYLSSFLNEPLRWHLMLRKRAVPFPTTYHFVAATSFMSYVFPARMGIPVRLGFAQSMLRLPLANASAFLLVDTVLFYAVWFSVALVGSTLLLGHGITVTSIGLCGAGVCAVLVLVRAGGPLLGRMTWLRSHRDQFVASLRTMPPTVLAVNGALVLLDVFVCGVQHWYIVRMFGGHAPLGTLVLMASVCVCAGFVSMMPLGLGAYDLSIGALLVASGVPSEIAVSVPLVNRLATFGTCLVLGGISMLRFGGESGRQTTA